MMVASLAQGEDAAVPETRWIHPKCTVLPFAKASFFVELGDGRLMTVENGTTIVSEDDGSTWSEPRPIYEGEGPGRPTTMGFGSTTAGPLLRTRDGALILIYRDMDSYEWNWDDATASTTGPCVLDIWSIRSLDEGKTWVDRQRLLDGYCGCINDIIQTTSGHIVVPVQDMLLDPVRHVQYTYVSADDGKTWQRSNMIDLGGKGHHDGALEGSVAELSDGRLLMMLRTNLGRLWEAYSNDHGHYWRVLRPSQMDASSAPPFIHRLASGRLALVWNRLYPEGQDSFAYGHGLPFSEQWVSWHREELSLAFSDDDGASWSEPVVIARQKNASIHYPNIFERRPGELWVITDISGHGEPGPPVCLSLKEEDFSGG